MATRKTELSRPSRGQTREGVSFPVALPRAELPQGYAETLGEIKGRIQHERLRVVMAANSAMVLLYWDIGRLILDRQEQGGWGAKVIDRLSADLREAFPEMRGLSLRNLKYMRALATAWPDGQIVQAPLAQITWYHHITLLERLDDADIRLWYAEQAIQHGWSQPILCMQIDGRAHERHGKAQNNFRATLPPADSDMAFSKAVSPLFGALRANTERSRTITALRDTLLPKLLSGELRVSAAEKEVAHHV